LIDGPIEGVSHLLPAEFQVQVTEPGKALDVVRHGLGIRLALEV
jgi:hypothetical protein